MSVHAPAPAHRCHWYAKRISAVPVQSPRSAVSGSPACAVPVIDGAAVLAGGRAAIGSVGSDVASAVPASLLAVTVTRRRWPTSAGVGRYASAVAPSIASHPSPSALQRCHPYARSTGSVPVHVPRSTWSSVPSTPAPRIVGGVTVRGGAGGAGRASTPAVASEVAPSVPPGPDAVTVTRSARPASSSVSA